MNDITVAELKAKKKELEKDLYRAIAPLIQKFREETGFAPDAMGVSFQEITAIDQSTRDYRVSEVFVTINAEDISL